MLHRVLIANKSIRFVKSHLDCIFLSSFSDILNICLLVKLLELEDLLMVHEVRDDVYGDGEDDGAVVLCRDTVEGLEVSQLK